MRDTIAKNIWVGYSSTTL